MEDVALDQVPGGVTESPNVFIQGGEGPFAGGDGLPVHGTAAGAPGLAEQQFFALAVGLVQGGPNPFHQGGVQQAHQVKPEAVHVVFPGPV